MSREIAIRTANLQPSDVVDGELIDAMVWHSLCSQDHPVIDSYVECCCSDTHSLDSFVCCGCGHHHDMSATCLPPGPCGSYVCCIN
jgi:hypothetical protein